LKGRVGYFAYDACDASRYDRVVRSRRRFRGLVKLDRGFVLELSGSCSCCESHDVRGLVGCAGRAERICDNCLELCREILRDEPRSSRSQPNISAEEFQRDVADVLESVVKNIRDEPRLDRVPRTVTPPNRSDVDINRCTFCRAHRKDVVKLINGPRVSICDGCVDEAIAVIT
jgi:hypothetical protein